MCLLGGTVTVRPLRLDRDMVRDGGLDRGRGQCGCWELVERCASFLICHHIRPITLVALRGTCVVGKVWRIGRYSRGILP
jgi:hypothetical protein